MKIFVTGVGGQLGYDVMMEIDARGRDITPVGSDVLPESKLPSHMAYYPLDLTDAAAVAALMDQLRPEVIVHCAAWTNVDGAEDPKNADLVRRVNVEATRTLAAQAKALGAAMIYISTDYVFDGQGTRPWQPDDKNYAPLNVYGQSKLDGELAVSGQLTRFFIVRTAWVFGLHGNNFIRTMLNISEKHDQVRVVCDQVGNPTYTKDLAALLVDMCERSLQDKDTPDYGYYHATNEGDYISWYDFTVEIYRQAGVHSEVIPVSSSEYEQMAGRTVAARPFNSRLDRSKLAAHGFRPLPPWQDAVHRFLVEIGRLPA